MFNGLQWWHVLIVVLVAVILFGGKRLPDAARGLGRSLRILKAEVGEMSSDKDKKDPAATDVPAAAASHPVTLTPTPLPAPTVEPIAPAQPVSVKQPISPTQITVEGRVADGR